MQNSTLMPAWDATVINYILCTGLHAVVLHQCHIQYSIKSVRSCAYVGWLYISIGDKKENHEFNSTSILS